jgi:hypothetical protein
MDKTVFKKETQVETISVLPRTLEVTPEPQKMGPAVLMLHPVYGKDPSDRKVWVATFVDPQEAEVFVMSSKTFGRPVLGAVMAGQGDAVVGGEAQKGAEMSDDAVAVGNEDTGPVGPAN